jgi:zinc D-Ala-D-Ala carboxypeptidase
MQYVSPHIDYATAIRSDMAKRKGLNNYFTPDQLERMKVVAAKVYEPLVEHFGIVIYISSFFRSKEVNKLIGGASTSQHMANNGAAMDLDAEMNVGVTNQQVFDYIKDNLEFDQLILEDIRPDGSIGWVHVSYNEGKNRKQVLTMVLTNGKKVYAPYDGKS